MSSVAVPTVTPPLDDGRAPAGEARRGAGAHRRPHSRRQPSAGGASLRGVLRVVRQEPSAVIFMAQLLAILLYPTMESSHAGRALFSAFGIAILGLVVRAVRSSPGRTCIGVLLAVPATIL